jgi:hypothetical protein
LDFALKKKTTKTITAATLALSLAIAIPMVALGTETTGCDGSVAGFADGDGTFTTPYEIETAEQLQLVATTGPSIWACSFLQTADITLPAATGTPLRNMAEPIGRFVGEEWDEQLQAFEGHYDGGGFSISNFRMDAADDNTQDKVLGLFGYVQHATIEGVRLVNPIVTQLAVVDHEPIGVGALVGNLVKNSEIYNVSISGAQITAFNSGGVLVGRVDNHNTLQKITISNSSISTPPELTRDATYLASVIGFSAEHLGIRDVHVSDFSINVNTSNVAERIGGFMTRCEEEMSISHSSVTGLSIDLVAGGTVRQVGGFISGGAYVDEACVFSDTSVSGSIEIEAGGELYAVGGFVGQLEEPQFLRTSTDVSMDLSSATQVYSIGGFAGRVNPTYGATFFTSESLVNARVSVTAPNIDRVGLYLGMGRFSLANSIVEGSISVDGDEIAEVSNLIGASWGHLDARLRELYNVIVKAQPINLNGGSLRAPITENDTERLGGYFIGLETSVDDLGGEGGGEADGDGDLTATRCLFWNSTTDPGATDPMGIGSPATSAQLGNASFLSSCGFDMERIWAVSRGEPKLLALNPRLYSSGSSGGSSSGLGNTSSTGILGAQVASNFKIKVTASEQSVRRYQLDLGASQAGKKVRLMKLADGKRSLVSDLAGRNLFTVNSIGKVTMSSKADLAAGDRLVVRKAKAGKPFGGKALASLDIQ